MREKHHLLAHHAPNFFSSRENLFGYFYATACAISKEWVHLECDMMLEMMIFFNG